MIKILIIVFIGVLVVALLGVVAFLFKRNQSDSAGSIENKAPNLRINPNATQHNQQLGQQQGQVPAQVAQNTVSNNQAVIQDALDSAQNFIEQQRYDVAETTLKQGLQVQPNDNGLALKLLNVYALTSNQNSFQEVFARIIANGDIQSIKQAEQLKSLLDSDITAKSTMQTQVDSTASNQASVSEPSLDLDFDGGLDFNPEPAETTLEMPSPATSSVDDGLSLDMDGLNFDSNIQNVTTNNGSDSLDSLGDISGMTGGLDSLESSLLADNNNLNSDISGNVSIDTPKANASTEKTFDFDLSLDETSSTTTEPTATQPATPVAQDSDLSLDFDTGLSLETPSTTPATEVNTASPGLGLDDLTLDGLNVPAVEEINQPSTDDLSIDGLDFNMDELNSTVETSTDTVNELTLDGVGDDLADFGLEKEAAIATGVAATVGAVAASGALQTENTQAETKEEDNEDGFDFSFDGLDDDISTNLNDTGLSDTDLGIDTPVEVAPVEPAIETPTIEVAKLADDFELSDFELKDDVSADLGTEDLASDLSIAPSPNMETVTETTTKPTAEIDEFSFDDFGLEETGLEEPSLKEAGAEVTPVIEEPSIDFNIDELSVDESNAEKTSLEEISVEKTNAEETAFDFETTDLSIDDGLGLDEVSIADTANLVEEVEVSEPTATSTIAPAVSETETVASLETASAEVPADMTAEFSILEELDSTQVTLDLATQYLDLGEYDSAKRLLQEIIDNGTDEQVQKAQNILAQAG